MLRGNGRLPRTVQEAPLGGTPTLLSHFCAPESIYTLEWLMMQISSYRVCTVGHMQVGLQPVFVSLSRTSTPRCVSKVSVLRLARKL